MGTRVVMLYRVVVTRSDGSERVWWQSGQVKSGSQGRDIPDAEWAMTEMIRAATWTGDHEYKSIVAVRSERCPVTLQAGEWEPVALPAVDPSPYNSSPLGRNPWAVLLGPPRIIRE